MLDCLTRNDMQRFHDDVIKWKNFPRYWPFVRGIHRSPVNYPHIGQWRGALMFSLIWSWMNDWVNNREAGGVRRHSAHYDVTVMLRFVVFCCGWAQVDFTHILSMCERWVLRLALVMVASSWDLKKSNQSIPKVKLCGRLEDIIPLLI